MTDIFLTRDQCRELDRRAIKEYGISGVVLMENAGRGCVDVLERLGIDGPVVMLCGKGNNAGDGFVIARHLEIRGFECRVLLVTRPDEFKGDAAANFAILKKTNVRISEVATQRPAAPPLELIGADWIVDALLGTGTHGQPRPPFDQAIDWINGRSKKTRALAVDIPSGLDCNTGRPTDYTVVADHTCTFAAKKRGYAGQVSKAYTGEVHVCDIGVPPQLIDEVSRLCST